MQQVYISDRVCLRGWGRRGAFRAEELEAGRGALAMGVAGVPRGGEVCRGGGWSWLLERMWVVDEEEVVWMLVGRLGLVVVEVVMGFLTGV